MSAPASAVLPQDSRAPAPSARPQDSWASTWPVLGFFALALFASVQYAELLVGPPVWRVLAVAAVASVGCATLSLLRPDGSPALGRAARVLVILATLFVALLAIGVPAHLLAPGGWPGLVRHVQGGVSGLGAWLWPYRGEAEWSRLAVLLVLPVTLVAAGALCFWPGPRGRGVRRGLALGLLLALLATGAANTPAYQPGLRGLLLLGLLAGWLWLGQVRRGQGLRAGGWLLACAVLALAARPVLAPSHPWLAFREQARAGGAFQWDQLYGPSSWPRSGATMLQAGETRPVLLRATSLDRFDGLRFLRSDSPPGDPRLDLGSGRHPSSWYLPATVTVVGLHSSLVPAPGAAHVRARWLDGEGVMRREADGTLLARRAMPAGAVYNVVAYLPRPTPAMLRRAGDGYPALYTPYTQFELPSPGASALGRPDLAAGARTQDTARLIGPLRPGATAAADARVLASPYGPMLQLARRLAAGAPSSYDVAMRIEGFLLSNYTYDENVAAERYPLEAFLFAQRRGYCQQFSGAMALMLRMDGIPARIGAGFRPAAYDSITGTWQVRALDAHAWVEVFFTGIGWVSFDPTPPAPRASAALPISRSTVLGDGAVTGPAERTIAPSAGAVASSVARGAGASNLDATLGEALLAVLLALLALGGGLWAVGHRRLRRALAGDGERAAAELREAVRAAAPQQRSPTLAGLHHRLAAEGSTAAADYVAALSAKRFAPGAQPPLPAHGRAALRRSLSRARPVAVRLRLLALIPPGVMR